MVSQSRGALWRPWKKDWWCRGHSYKSSRRSLLFLLMALPRELWIDILVNWIQHPACISALDIAIPNLFRAPFYSLLRNLEVPLLSYSGKYMSNYIHWVSQRRVKVKYLSIQTKLIAEMEEGGEVTLSSVEHLQLLYAQAHFPLLLSQLNHLFNSCSSLKAITFSSISGLCSSDFRLIVRSLAHVPLQCLVIDILPRDCSDAEIGLIAKTWGPSLVSLCCKEVALSVRNLSDMARHCTALQTLQLSFSDKFKAPARSALLDFFKQMSQITSLSLRDNCLRNAVLDDELVCDIAQALPQLVHLDLPVGRNISYNVFHLLSIRHLQYMTKGSYVYFFKRDVVKLSVDNSLSDIQTVLPHISRQNLIAIEIRVQCAASHSLCIHIAEHCREKLVEFTAELEGESWSQNDSLLHILHYCPNLRALQLFNCSLLVPQNIEAMMKFCPMLMKIAITNHSTLTNKVVVGLVKYYGAKLTHLNFSGCSLLSDELFLKMPLNCVNLLCLDLSNTQVSKLGLDSFTLTRQGVRQCKVKV